MGALIAYADGVDDFIGKVSANIINPAIEFAFIIALVVFLWGVLQFIRNANNEKKRDEGKDHIMYGLIGFLIMFGVYAIVNIIGRTFGVGVNLSNDQQTFNPPCVQDIKINGENQGSFLPCKK